MARCGRCGFVGCLELRCGDFYYADELTFLQFFEEFFALKWISIAALKNQSDELRIHSISIHSQLNEGITIIE